MLTKITLQGLDRLVQSGLVQGVTDLWDGLTVPEGANKQTLIDAILYRSFEFPVLYMDARTVHDQIKIVSEMYADSMERTWAALTADYNPIHNFDRYEDSTDDREGSDTRKGHSTQTGTGQSTESNEDSGTSSTGYAGDTADTFHPSDKSDSSSRGKVSGDSKTTADTSTEDSGQSKDKLTHSGHLYGNIGVTTSQQMITAEIDMRLVYNWYDTFAQMFTRELCVGIY